MRSAFNWIGQLQEQGSGTNERCPRAYIVHRRPSDRRLTVEHQLLVGTKDGIMGGGSLALHNWGVRVSPFLIRECGQSASSVWARISVAARID